MLNFARCFFERIGKRDSVLGFSFRFMLDLRASARD
jgi:hypothetical protein